MSKYKKINKLEEIIDLAKESIGNEPYELNFNLKVEFDLSLTENSLKDVSELAQEFQKLKCPETLYMNHGQYIHKKSDGIQNVVNELKNKKTSNRAIISLINQEDIVGSGDNPIPSFMILQFSIEENNNLYVTVYFRALEVSKFLRINIEEIRIIIKKIKEEIVTIGHINLNILAFRAYIDEDINPLQRSKLDLLEQIEIFGFLKQDIEPFIELLEEKKTSSTRIEYTSFDDILICLNNDASKNDINRKINKPLVRKLFKELIEISKKIEDLRIKSSHSNEINTLQKNYKLNIENIINEIRNDS